MSGGIGMFDRLNSLVCNDRFKLPVVTPGRWRLRHSGGIVKELNTARSFAIFNAPYNPVRLIYEKKTASIQCLILRLIIRCALRSRKYGN